MITLTLFGSDMASMFFTPVIIYTQSKDYEEGIKLITSVTDGTRHKEDGKIRKAEM